MFIYNIGSSGTYHKMVGMYLGFRSMRNNYFSFSMHFLTSRVFGCLITQTLFQNFLTNFISAP
jgi:hypothetical protein